MRLTKTWDSNLKSGDGQNTQTPSRPFLSRKLTCLERAKVQLGKAPHLRKELVEILRLLGVNSINLPALT